MKKLQNSRKNARVELNEIEGTKFTFERFGKTRTEEVVKKLEDGTQIWVTYGVVANAYFVAEPTVGALLSDGEKVIYKNSIENAVKAYNNKNNNFCSRTVYERLA